MALLDRLTNVKYWIVAALAFGLVIGDIGSIAQIIVMVTLIAMMTASLIGLEIKREDVTRRKSELVFAVICCYGIASAAVLLSGMLLEDNLWSGWVLIASVPCAVSVISATLIMRGDVKLSITAVTLIYIVALVFTPLFTKVMLGNAVSPFEIVKYVVLFVFLPLLISIPLKRVRIPPKEKNVLINACFFILIGIAFGVNRDVIFGETMLVTTTIAASLIRIVAVFLIMEMVLRRIGMVWNLRVVFVLIAVWKNSALAMTLTLILIPDAEAAMPAAILVPMETIWLMFMIWYYRREAMRQGTSLPSMG